MDAVFHCQSGQGVFDDLILNSNGAKLAAKISQFLHRHATKVGDHHDAGPVRPCAQFFDNLVFLRTLHGTYLHMRVGGPFREPKRGLGGKLRGTSPPAVFDSPSMPRLYIEKSSPAKGRTSGLGRIVL